MKIEIVKFHCKNGHEWYGRFIPDTFEGAGTLIGTWKCPKCNDYGDCTVIAEYSATLESSPETVTINAK